MDTHTIDLSLTQLSEAMLQPDFKAMQAWFATNGCPVTCDENGWTPLAGGREYTNCAAGPMRVDGLPSISVIEISRMSADPATTWVDVLELRPEYPDDTAWVDEIRRQLAQGFELIREERSNIEVYQRGSLEESILFAGSATELPRVMMRRRSLLRSPD